MCDRIKGVMISRDFKPGFTTLVRIKCGMWSCRQCGPENATHWRAYLLNKFNKDMRDERWIFATITATGKAHRDGPIATLTQLQKAWKKLYDHLLRRYGKGLQYVRVFEQHASGNYHMHFLLNAGTQYDAHGLWPKDLMEELRHPECKWLRKVMVKLKAGWRVHIRRVWETETKKENVGLVVGYIVKYLGKNMSIMLFPKHQRRIQTSRKIGSPNTSRSSSGTWEHKRELSEKEFNPREKWLDLSTGELLTWDSFEGEAYYPPLRYYRGDENE